MIVTSKLDVYATFGVRLPVAIAGNIPQPLRLSLPLLMPVESVIQWNQMIDSTVSESPDTFEPTTLQLERKRRLRQFNWKFVYIPVLLGGVALVAIVGLLIWQTALAPFFNVEAQTQYARHVASSLADMIFILLAVPAFILMLLFPLLIIGTMVEGRRRGIAPLVSLQRLFWRLENVLGRLARLTDSVTQKLSLITIRINKQFNRIESGASRLLTAALKPTRRTRNGNEK